MAKKKLGASGVPSGYVVLGGGFAKPWEPTPGTILEGIVSAKRTIDAKKAGRQRAKKGDVVTILDVVDNETGEICAVWESAALTDLMKVAKPGDSVYLKLVRIKKMGKRSFKDFAVGHKPKGK